MGDISLKCSSSQSLCLLVFSPQQQHQQMSAQQLQELPVSFHSHTWVKPTLAALTQEDSKIHGVVLKLMPLENTLLATMLIVELDVLWRFLVRMKYFLHLKVS